MKSIMLLPVLVTGVVLFARSGHEVSPRHKFSELTQNDRERLDRQRAIIADTVRRRYGTAGLTQTLQDLPILQKLLDEKVFHKSQTYELQSLGVTFGDVLASEFPLRWVIVTDEFGSDPTLRFKNKDLNVDALTMISKRVERDEPVNLLQLVRDTREALARYEKRSR
jgi:hypothetical protein